MARRDYLHAIELKRSRMVISVKRTQAAAVEYRDTCATPEQFEVVTYRRVGKPRRRAAK